MATQLISDAVTHHLTALVPKRSPELARMERIAARTDFPIIGPAVGHLCYLMARQVAARRIFELGSGFGYSTAWFARAVHENGGGDVHHVVWDKELSARARAHLSALGYADVVRFTVDEAVQALRRAEGEFDVIFNDINKRDYPAALPVIEEKLRRGGLLIVDNVLWSGRIFDKRDKSADTDGIRKFTRLVSRSPRWTMTIIPIRDGVLIARKN